MANNGVQEKQTKVKEKAKKTAQTTAHKVKNTAKVVRKKAKDLDSKKVREILLKEEMTKKHKYILFLFSSILIAFMIYLGVRFVVQNVRTFESTLEEIELSTYEQISKGEEKQVVYIATKNNDMYQKYEDILVEVVRGRKTKVKFLDLGLVKERHQIIGFMNATDFTKDSYTEPMILIFEDGKVKASLLGVSTKKELISFLDKNRID